jgi:hypothetical protein
MKEDCFRNVSVNIIRMVSVPPPQGATKEHIPTNANGPKQLMFYQAGYFIIIPAKNCLSRKASCRFLVNWFQPAWFSVFSMISQIHVTWSHVSFTRFLSCIISRPQLRLIFKNIIYTIITLSRWNVSRLNSGWYLPNKYMESCLRWLTAFSFANPNPDRRFFPLSLL